MSQIPRKSEAGKVIHNFKKFLEADPPPSEERKTDLILKCLKVCASFKPALYSTEPNCIAIGEFANTYAHQLSEEAFSQAQPYLETIVEKNNTYCPSFYLFIRKFNDQYKLIETTPLGAAIKARDEDLVIALLSEIPQTKYKYLAKPYINLLELLTRLLLVKPIKYLADTLSELEFNELYQFSKEDISESPLEGLGSRTYHSTKLMALGRAIAKIFLMKNVPISGSDIAMLKRAHVYPTLPADLARIKTRRGERRTPAKRAVPYPAAYFILGHGGDYNFHTSLRIPHDTAIIAKATSGQLLSASKTDALAPLYDLHNKPYINPLKKDNLLYLLDKYKYFSLFTEQSLYPNFTYTLLSTFPQGTHYMLGYSGVIKYPFKTPSGEVINSRNSMDTIHIPKSDKLSAHVQTFLNSYTYSIYPKTEQVHHLMLSYLSDNPDITVEQFVKNAESEPNNIIRVSQQFLFDTLEHGIYYNFVCRAALFTDRLYENGFVIDDSMRGLIREGPEHMEVRGGLRQIISEALTTRAGIIKAAMKAALPENNGSASASAGLAASASAASPSIASHFVKMRSMIIKLRQKFSNEKFFEFIEYLQPRIHALLDSTTDGIVIENQQYLSEQLPDLFEKITNVREHYITIIKFLNELYINGHIIMEGSDPSYLKQLEISDELEQYIIHQPNDALIARFKHKPIYMLEYMKNGELMTLFHIAMRAHKYKFAHWLFEKTPRIAHVYVPMFNIRPFYFDLLKIKGPYVPAYEPLRDIVSKINNFIKPIFVIGQLKKDMTVDARARYKIFEPYILERQLHIQHPEIADTMRRFGMLAAAAAAPQSTLAQRLAALRAQIPKNLSNSNSNSNSAGKGKKTYKKHSSSGSSSSSSSSSKSSNKKKTVKSHSKSNSSNSE